MAQQVTKSTKSYNPKRDQVRSIREKINLVFTDHQLKLVSRPDVTKSLILALTKVVDFKQPIDEVVSKWVKQDVDKFMRTLPLITVHY